MKQSKVTKKSYWTYKNSSGNNTFFPLFSLSYIFLISFIFGCLVLKATVDILSFSCYKHIWQKCHNPCMPEVTFIADNIVWCVAALRPVELGFSTCTLHLPLTHSHSFTYTDRNISNLNTHNAAGLLTKWKALFCTMHDRLLIDGLFQQGIIMWSM